MMFHVDKNIFYCLFKSELMDYLYSYIIYITKLYIHKSIFVNWLNSMLYVENNDIFTPPQETNN